MPPPYEPTTTPSSLGADYVHLEGHKAEASALIIVTNNSAPREKLGVVTMANDNGDWSCDVWGHKGEVLQVTQTVGHQESPTIVFIIR